MKEGETEEGEKERGRGTEGEREDPWTVLVRVTGVVQVSPRYNAPYTLI